MIEKGDLIVEGNPAPHDILAIKGVEELAAYLVNEIQEVYRLQGVASTTSTSRSSCGRCCRRSRSTKSAKPT